MLGNSSSGNVEGKTAGIWYAVGAYSAWGILPLYWKALNQIPAGEILAHRVLWSCVFVAFLLSVLRRWGNLRPALTTKQNRLGVFLGAFLISANWFIYIWAVNSNRVVEASLGYYINPLFTVFLGLVVLKERLDAWQIGSLLLALLGVAIVTWQYGQIPWVAFLLAVTFGLYGLVKKLVNVDSMTGLALETLFVTPAALAYLLFQQLNGAASLSRMPWSVTLLLLCSGAITAVPLLWFAQAAKRVPLSTIGFIQYLSPTISLLLGIFLFKEPFTKVDLLSFGLIWISLVLYSLSRTSLLGRLQPRLSRNDTY
ncbi:MAG: EamA family transporter RarD [Desulfitobacteriaceae bacterium]